MKRLLTIILLSISVYSSNIVGQWQKHIVDENMTPRCVSLNVADLNADNEWDILVTNGGERKIILYQNDFPQWKVNIIDDNVVPPFATPGDMDGDDTLDVAACLYLDRKMVWYENNLPEEWTQHIIAENTNWNDYVVVVDINNDNKLDVVSAVTASEYNHIGDVIWYENNHPEWIPHIIESDINGCGYIDVADIDGDGLHDIIATMDKRNEVVWYKNENEGLTWSKDTIDNDLTYAWIVNCADVDEDGKMDIVATAGGPYHNGSDVVWYENNYPTWTKHIIDTDLDGANFAEIVDVDGDGRLDVIAGGYEADYVVWYKNNHPSWYKNIIDADLDGPRDIKLEDLDGDGIDDVIVAAFTSVVWFKNPYTSTAFTKSIECHPRYISPDEWDTLHVNAIISNPDNHDVLLYPSFKGVNSDYLDSLDLFDDGLHDDSSASDNIFGGSKNISNVPEDFFEIELYTTDLTDTVLNYPIKTSFTTAGPLVIDTFSIEYINDSLILISNLFLTNIGKSLDIPYVSLNLVSIDSSNTRVTFPSTFIGKIPAGTSKKPWQELAYIRKGLEQDRFVLEILSDEIVYWKDTLLISHSSTKPIYDTFEFEGLSRDYIVYKPQNYQSKMPLVVMLHGSYPDDAEWMMNYTQMNEVADTAGFIVVYPYSVSPRWNANSGIPSISEPNVNDVGYIETLIDTMKSQYNIDLNSVYCCGLNYGGWMASEVICQIGHRFVAGARVNTSLGDNQAARSTLNGSFPIVLFNGTADTYLPWPEGKEGVMGGEEAINWWVEQNECSPFYNTVSLLDIDPDDGCTVEKISYKNSSDETMVVFYKVINGGLSWPGAVGDEPWDKPRNMDINAGVEIWNFFKNYSRQSVSAVKDPKELPEKFALSQNYPNPFNPSTTLKYEIPKESFIALKVYDILGREVATLVNEQKKAGYYEINWNASNNSSGIYFYRIQAGAFVETKKMVFMK